MIESPIGAAIRSIVRPNPVNVAPHTEELIRQLDQYTAEEGELEGKRALLNQLYPGLKK